MNQRFQNEEIKLVAERYAENELYKAVSSIGPQLEAELTEFGLCPEECFMEAIELLSAIADKGEGILSEVDGIWQPDKNGLGLGKVLDYIGVNYEKEADSE